MRKYQTREALVQQAQHLLIYIMALVTIILFHVAYFQWVLDQRQMMTEYTADLMEMQDQDPNKDWTDSGLEIPDRK